MLLAACDTPPNDSALELPPAILYSVLRIETGKELLAGRHLEARGIQAYIPTYSHVRRWRDHAPQELQRALFPGYAFAILCPATLSLALQSPGVYDMLTTGSHQPALLDQTEMDRIRALGTYQAEPWRSLDPGDRVRILDGPFANTEGLLLRRRNSMRFIISIAILGRSASIEFDGWQMERI
jgi:transcriptional antiterminator RfaH